MKYLSTIIIASLTMSSAVSFADDTSLGFPLGEKSKLHTNLHVGIAYDSNATRGQAGAELEGVKTRFSPTISVSVPGSAFSFGLNGGINIDQFVDGTAPCGREAGDGSTTCVGGFAGFSIRGGGSNSILGFEIDGSVVATPTEILAPPSASADGSTTNSVRLLTDLGADELLNPAVNLIAAPTFVLRPGGGALEFRVGYNMNITNYSELGEEERHVGRFEAKLKFLPRTAVVLNADFGSWNGTDVGNNTPLKATPYNLTVGLRGQLTNRLSANINAGYGDTLNEDSNFAQQSPLANATLRYMFAKGMSLDAGFDRMLNNSLREFSYVSNRARLNGSFEVAERLSLALTSSYEWREFASGQPVTQAIAGARVSYLFFKFMNAGLTYQFLDQSFEGTEAPSPAAGIAVRSFTRQLFMFSTEFRY
ncbi:MAG: outer membrane beta-barrel protein [Myxococcota bacterium]|nr:outer membrane beta-barrel protein [Myxococcota bacterium]